MFDNCPTVQVNFPPNRDYTTLLTQTTKVYNMLLKDKQHKLYTVVMKKKEQYDAHCSRLEQEDKQKAIEYGVTAQESLNKMQRDCDEELVALHQDYQQKLHKMYVQLEQKWRQERAGIRA